jgi:DNA-binding GntR family transcriptional regulator
VDEPHRDVAVASPDPASIRDVYRARAVLEGAGVRRWPVAPEELREHVRTSLVAYTSAARSGASYPQLEERHRAFHVSLVALTGSPRLVHLAEDLVAELGPALAQVARTGRDAHDRTDSHAHLVRLLERGDHDAASHYLARHLADAEVDVLAALGPS